MNKWELFQAVEQVDDGLLEDAEEFLQRSRTSRPRSWVKWGAMAACLTVAVCALWTLGPREPVKPAETAAMSDPKASEELLPTETQPAGPVAPVGSDQITRPVIPVVFNQLDGAPSSGDTYGGYLCWDDFVPMTWEEMMDHYGVTLPLEETVSILTPVGPKDDREYGWGIYRTESGIVYHDTNTFAFGTDDGSVRLSVTMSTGMTGAYSTFAMEELGDSLAFTTIKGWELALFQYKNGAGDNCCCVEFCQNGIRYRVRGKNLGEQEFAAVLESLLEERGDYTPGEPRTFTGEYHGGIGLQTLMSTNPDGSVTVEESWIGFLHMELEEGEAYTYLTLMLSSEELERFSDLSIGDPVTVTFVGEPATIGTVWPQQLVSVERVEG